MESFEQSPTVSLKIVSPAVRAIPAERQQEQGERMSKASWSGFLFGCFPPEAGKNVSAFENMAIFTFILYDIFL